jgi:hypothetical protein
MIKKGLHILFIAVLALNLMGAWVFASAFDCGMECCKAGEWAGTTSFEAPSCCAMDDVTCVFETGQYEELFDTAICSFNSATSHKLPVDNVTSTMVVVADTPTLRYSDTAFLTPPPQPTPLYLSNASLLC